MGGKNIDMSMTMIRLLFLNLAFAAAASASPIMPLRHRFLAPIAVVVRRATINQQHARSATAITGKRVMPPIASDVVSRGGASKSQGAADSMEMLMENMDESEASASVDDDMAELNNIIEPSPAVPDRSLEPRPTEILSAACTRKPPVKLLRWAYTAAGIATTTAWSTMVYTTIRSNQPTGAMMPCWQHGFFARIGAMSAASLIVGSFASLAATCSASNAESWEQLGSSTPSFRRHNLALATTGVASALWVRFAETVTRIPGTNPLVSHQSYTGAMQARLIGCYGSAAALGAVVWARSLPDDCRNPLSWPKRIADGVSKSLVSIAPKSIDDPVQVKYSLLTSSFLIFTGMQTVCNMPISVIPSWTSRRLSRAFPIYTFLGAATAFDLKEATESGRLLIDRNYRYLSNGIKGFGGLYLGARAGAVFFDPSFPEAFHAVNQVPGLAVAAIIMVALALRSDEK